MQRILVVLSFILVSLTVQAQISTPEKTKFNVGLYAGLSIMEYRPMGAIDVSYKGTTLRVMPHYHYYGLGLTQELVKVSTVFYNIYWTASFYGGYRADSVVFSGNPVDNYYKKTMSGTLSTGIKTYFAKRMYSHIMAGATYSQSSGGNGVEIHTPEIQPYFEFGLGVQIFKNYPKLKSEETEE